MKRLSRLQNYNVRRRRWNLTTSNWMANIGQVYDRLLGWDMHKGTRHVHFGERRWQTQQIEISIDALIEIEISLSTNKKKRRIWMKGKFQVFYFFDKLQTIFLSRQSALYEWCLEKWDLCVISARERSIAKWWWLYPWSLWEFLIYWNLRFHSPSQSQRIWYSNIIIGSALCYAIILQLSRIINELKFKFVSWEVCSTPIISENFHLSRRCSL